MKKTITLALLAMSISLANAQESKGRLERNKDFITFGFDVGINKSRLAFSNATGSYSTPGSGYRLGFVTNFRLGDQFSIVPKAELSFNGARVSDSQGDYKVSLSTMELIAHLKYKTKARNLSSYVVAGPNLRVPLLTRTQDGSFFTQENLAIDFGVGIDLPIFKYRISPEIRYSLGLKEMRSGSSLGNLSYNNFAFVVVFSGL